MSGAIADERRGLPSASQYPRIFHCPGFLNLKRVSAVPDREDPAWTKSGQRIASALEGALKVESLTDDEQTMFHLLAAGRRGILSATLGDDESWTVRQEERFWLQPNGAPIFSGRVDYLAHNDRQFVIIDDKSGHSEVTKAPGNLQLRALAVMVAIDLKLESGFVAVNQPWFKPPFSLAFYSARDLSQAGAEMIYALGKAKDPKAPRIPGEWCKYCPAALYCAEGREHARKIGDRNLTAVTTNEGLGEFLAECYAAEDNIRAAKDEVRRRLIAGEQVPGWRLKPGDVRTFISNPQAVFERAADLGVSRDAFMSAVLVDKTRLRDVIKQATRLRGLPLDRAMENLLRDCIDEKSFGPSLERSR